jgi:hypothetical protein
MLRLSRTKLEKRRQKGKFWAGAKFAFLLKEQIKNCQRADFYFKIVFIW